MQKRETLLEIAKNLGVKGKLDLPEGLFGYGRISYNEADCIGCSKCEENCSEKVITFKRIFDLPRLFEAEDKGDNSKKGRIISLLKDLAQKRPQNPIFIPELVYGYGDLKMDIDRCIGCGNCSRHCPGGALKMERILEVI